jgi:hypothetical protein
MDRRASLAVTEEHPAAQLFLSVLRHALMPQQSI